MRLSALTTLVVAMALSGAWGEPGELTGRPFAASLSDELDPQVSPDGRWLAFVRRDGQHRQLCLLRLDKPGQSATQVAAHLSDSWAPSWSPDSRRLAFLTTRTDALGDVAVVKVPAGTPRSLSTTGTAEASPQWRDAATLSWESDAFPPGVRRRFTRTGRPLGPDPVVDRAAWPGELHRSGNLAVVATGDSNSDGNLGDGDMAAVLDLADPDRPRMMTRSWANLAGVSALPDGALVACVRRTAGLDLVEAERDASLTAPAEELLSRARSELAEGHADAARDIAMAASLKADAEGVRLDATAVWLGLDVAQGRAAAMLGLVDALCGEQPDTSLVGSLRLRACVEEATRLDSRGAGQSPTLGKLFDRVEAALRGVEGGAAASQLHLARASLLARSGRTDAALLALDDAAQAHPSALGQSRLLRAGVYDTMRLTAEGDRELLSACRDPRLAPDEARLALEELVARVRHRSPRDSGRELVTLADGLPEVQPREFVLLAAARDLCREGRLDQAERLLEGMLDARDATAEGRLSSALLLADMDSALGRHEKAVERLALVGEGAGDAAGMLRGRARRGLHAQLEAQGRQALALGDPALARAVFTRVLAEDPESVTAWRGRIESEATMRDLAADSLITFRRATKSRPDDALAWYRLGLALSYKPGEWRSSAKALERAVALDPSVHWYRQTLGFVREQLWRATEDRQQAIEAQDNYEAAIALLPADADARAVASLYQNAGNIALEIGRDDEAARLLERRAGTGAAFDHPLTELLFHRSHGIALFRSGRASEGEAAFARALRALDPARARGGPLSAEAADALGLELMDRRALALNAAGDRLEAARVWKLVAARAGDAAASRVRALRNAGLALLAEAGSDGTVAQADTLAEAGGLLRAALDALSTAVESKLERGRQTGAIGVSVEMAPDAARGGAQVELSLEDEERLIRGGLAQVSAMLGDPASQAASLAAQRELAGRTQGNSRPYEQALVCELLLREAELAVDAGDMPRGARTLVEVLLKSRVRVGGNNLTNVDAATRAALRLAELSRRSPELPPSAQLASHWVFHRKESRRLARTPWRAVLSEVLRRLEELPELAEADLPRARLLLGRALLADGELPGTPAAQVNTIEDLRRAADLQIALRAVERLASDVRASLSKAAPSPESARLSVASIGLLLSCAARRGDDDAVEELRAEGLGEAWSRGFPELGWWLEAQVALHHPRAEAREAARARVLEAIAMLAPGDALPGDEVAWDVLDAVEACGGGADFAGDWDDAERWRAARLVLLAGRMRPESADGNEAVWLAGLEAARGRLMQLNGALRRALPGEESAGALRVQAGEARAKVRGLLDEGRGLGFKQAALLAPRPMTFEDASIVFEPEGIVPRPAALVLARRGPSGARTRFAIGGRETTLSREELARTHPLWLVLGDGEVSPPPGAEAVHLLSTESLLSQIGSLPLLVTEARARIGESPASEVAAGAEIVDVAGALPRVAGDPLSRVPAGSSRTLGGLLAGVPGARVLGVDAEGMAPSRSPFQRADDLALVSSLQGAGFAQVELRSSAPQGAKWIGPMIHLADGSPRATDALDSARGEALEALRDSNAGWAASALTRTLRLKEALGDDAEVTTLNMLLAQAYSDAGRPDLAIPPGQAAVEGFRASGDTRSLQDALLRLGGDASRAKSWKIAEESFAEAGSLARSAGDDAARLKAVLELAIVLENSGKFQEAIARFEEAERLSLDAHDEAGALMHRLRVARVLSVGLNDYAGAEAVLRDLNSRITHYHVRAMTVPEGLGEAAVRVHLDLGRVLERRGLYSDSQAETMLALEAARAAGAAGLEGEALRDLANIAWLRSDYLESFRRQREALAIAERTGDLRLRVSLHNVAGLLRWSVGDGNAALAEFDRAVQLSGDLGDDRELASSMNNHAIALRALRRYDEALAGFEATFKADERAGSRWGMAYARRNLGITLIEMGRAADALEPLEYSLSMAREIGDRTSAAKSLLFRADAFRATERAAEARAGYEEALAEADSIPLPEVVWRAHFGLGRLARDAGDLGSAAIEFRAAIDRIESLRASIRLEEFQDGFLADKQAPYDALVATLLDWGDVRGAFETSERSRGRNFIDLLGNREIALADARDSESLAREKSLRLAIEEAERALGENPAQAGAGLRKRLEACRAEYADFLLELRARNPQLAAFIRVDPVGLEEVQALIEGDTRLLVYHVTDSETVAWVIGPDSIRAARTPVGRGELASQVESLRRRIQSQDDVNREIDLLSRTLLAPVAGDLAGARRVGIIPHRELHALPFSALRPVPGGEPLIATRGVFGAPGCSVLRHTFARRGTFGPGGRLLAVGDPDTAGALPALPFAQREAERLAVQYPQATVLTGGEATETWLSRNIGDYSIVHIASHGEFDPANPLYSAIRLAPDAVNDGLLTSGEVFGLAQRADLVALSACQSGLGRLSNGDDIIGLNRAFVFAGTRQVLSTLWRVDDVSTAVLMKHFYRNMGGMDRAEALRQAQLAVRSRHPHPAHWAGVVLSGDWR